MKRVLELDLRPRPPVAREEDDRAAAARGSDGDGNAGDGIARWGAPCPHARVRRPGALPARSPRTTGTCGLAHVFGRAWRASPRRDGVRRAMIDQPPEGQERRVLEALRSKSDWRVDKSPGRIKPRAAGALHDGAAPRLPPQAQSARPCDLLVQRRRHRAAAIVPKRDLSMVNIDEIAARAGAKLRGRVTPRRVREVIAAALGAALDQALAEAEALVTSRRLLGAIRG